MKKISKILFVLMFIAFGASNSFAQIVVRVRPARPAVVVARPPAPSRFHVWVDEDWVPQGGTYAWHGGYWAAPPHPGARYIPGHWRDTRRGAIWIQGHWR